MVLAGELRHLGQGRDPGEDPLAVVGVQPGLVALGRLERPGLSQMRLETPDPAEIVQVPGDAHVADVVASPSVGAAAAARSPTPAE